MNWSWRTTVCAVLVLAAASLAACGSSSDSTSSSAAETTSGSEAASESTGIDTAAAEELTVPFIGSPTAFPVDEPLKERPPAGTTFAFLQCSSPFCGIMAEQLQGATKAMGADLKIVKAGASASELQGAMASIITLKPDAVIIPAVEESIPKQLEELDEMGIPVAGAGVMDAERYALDVNFQGSEVAAEAGRAFAGWTVLQKGEEANAVVYATPELSFSSVVEEAYNEELSELCSSCPVRSVTIPLSEFGSKAPGHVVSDLQANPETNVAIFASQEGAAGLPAQMKTAGLEGIDINGYGATPSTLQDVQDNGMKGTMAIDTNVMLWAIVDGLARVLTDQPLTATEEKGQAPMQLLEQKELEGVDVSHGFIAYPDSEKRFEELWSGK